MTNETPESPALLDWAVESVLERWPAASEALIGFRVGCIGCQLSAFHTLREVAMIYGLSAADLLREIHLATRGSSTSGNTVAFEQGEV